ncbi:unnamed protein product, partial [Acanthocheilonema viteae]
MKVAGIDHCVLLLDSCSVKKIYVGPLLASKFDHILQTTHRINKSLADVVSMNFTKICPKSECIYYLSPLDFFFYCCCNTNFELCAYTSNEKSLSYASKNAEVWANNFPIRSFLKVDLHNVKTVSKVTGNLISTGLNTPLHLCAIGTYNVTIGNWKKEDFTVKIGKRELLAEPQKFCYFIASLQFKQTERKPPTSHIFPCMSQLYSYLMIYFNRRFDDTYIKCSRYFLFDTFDEVMLIEDYSFYSPKNLTLKKLYKQGKNLDKMGQKYNMTIQHGCIRKIFLPILDPFCRLLIPVLTNVIQCSCFQSPRLQQPCDANFEKAVHEEGSKITVPICLKTSGNLKNLSNDEYNFGILGSAKYIKAQTKNYPLCYDMVAIDPHKYGVEHRSGPFDE